MRKSAEIIYTFGSPMFILTTHFPLIYIAYKLIDRTVSSGISLCLDGHFYILWLQILKLLNTISDFGANNMLRLLILLSARWSIWLAEVKKLINIMYYCSRCIYKPNLVITSDETNNKKQLPDNVCIWFYDSKSNCYDASYIFLADIEL